MLNVHKAYMKFSLRNINKILRCSFGLKCPRCCKGSLFQRWFTMFARCPECELKYEREQGYFIGAMYINYGATVCLVFPGYFATAQFTFIPFLVNLCFWGVVSAIFPIYFYRYSKSLWINIDYAINPKD